MMMSKEKGFIILSFKLEITTCTSKLAFYFKKRKEITTCTSKEFEVGAFQSRYISNIAHQMDKLRKGGSSTLRNRLHA
jgi:hypothetical protein